MTKMQDTELLSASLFAAVAEIALGAQGPHTLSPKRVLGF